VDVGAIVRGADFLEIELETVPPGVVQGEAVFGEMAGADEVDEGKEQGGLVGTLVLARLAAAQLVELVVVGVGGKLLGAAVSGGRKTGLSLGLPLVSDNLFWWGYFG